MDIVCVDEREGSKIARIESREIATSCGSSLNYIVQPAMDIQPLTPEFKFALEELGL